jgi:hypothetical protein
MIMSLWRHYVSELLPPTGLLFIPQLIYAHVEQWGEWSRQENLFVHRSSLAILPASHLVASRRNGRRELCIRSCEVFLSIFASDFFTCRKIFRHGASGFTFSPKESVLRISIALENPSSRPGLIPRTLGLVASTLTITPPRLLDLCYIWTSYALKVCCVHEMCLTRSVDAWDPVRPSPLMDGSDSIRVRSVRWGSGTLKL